MTDVLEANADHYRNEKLRMTFLAGCTGGRARQQLASRRRPEAPNAFQTAEEMFEVLKLVFDDPDRRQTAAQKFQRLYQGGKDFNNFWVNF